MQEVDRLGWAVTVPLRAGDHVLGVRANTHELGQQLREVFADRLVPDADPPPNLSVYVAPEATDGPQELHRLYVTYTRTLRTRSQDRLLEAVWHELDMRDVASKQQETLVDAAVLVREGRAHLFPAADRRRYADEERRLWKDGFELVLRRWVALNVADGCVHVPVAPGLTPVPHTAGAPLAALCLPIASWSVEPGPDSAAWRLTQAAGQILDRPGRFGRTALAAQSRLLERLPDAELA